MLLFHETNPKKQSKKESQNKEAKKEEIIHGRKKDKTRRETENERVETGSEKS